MKFSLIVASLSSAALLVGCGKPPKVAPPQFLTPEVQLAADVPADCVRGSVVFEGTPPERRPVRMSSSEGCGVSGTPPLNEAAVITDGKIANVFVVVKDGLAAKAVWPVPSTPVTLRQSGCMFVPHVVALQVGQTLLVNNADMAMHNVNAKSQRSEGARFNRMHAPGAKDIEVQFSAPERSVPFGCDFHPWMSAWVHAVEHPFFAVSALDGSFEIRGLAPGRYRFDAVHEWLGTHSFEVTLDGRSGARVVLRHRAAAAD